MAQFWQVAVKLPHISGFDRDAVVNTFAVAMPDDFAPSTDMLDLSASIVKVYNHLHNGDQVAGFLSPGLSRVTNAAEIHAYDVSMELHGEPHGSGVEDRFTLAAAGGTVPLPEEVALCVTLRADNWEDQLVETADSGDAGSAPDRPRSRYTGRFYLGPFNTLAQVDASDTSRPDPAELIPIVLDSVEACQDSLAAVGGSLCVWSRKDGVFRTVTQVQVDDAWDTQRRRGRQAVTRVTRTINP